MTKEIINFEDFLKIDMRVGTILEVAINKKARKPAYVLSLIHISEPTRPY